MCDELSRIAALLYSGSDGNKLQLVGLACNSLGSSDISMVLFLFCFDWRGGRAWPIHGKYFVTSEKNLELMVPFACSFYGALCTL